jgi:chemotaxis protein methyltransferase CheR
MKTAQSEEARLHLRDAHQRIMSVATAQQQLQASGHCKPLEVGPYLSRLCDTLGASMIGDGQPISLKVEVGAGTAPSDELVSIGLITTELVINALKHGFPIGAGGCEILVRYGVDECNWRLSVSDNGIGVQRDGDARGRTGLGTTIVEALAHQLKACVEITRLSPGMNVSIVHTARKVV